ncbi:basic-leucine zipper bzip transcription factor [Fusarium sporotrichioides]|uniref:Basic-leucine zipper bzip transcription factor n=1 Tax=Fusarium sporotrichioides TaxID=5514 RepID=A0A395SBN3_FUSSP|nr:basic-leucine zipper bzip transcription factor [Fusarium sporotrichioides]
MSRRREGSFSSRDEFLSSFLNQDATTELPAADNWRNIQDRNEKKKVQNRVAQRAYRSRMKARIEQLEGMLECQTKEVDKQANRKDDTVGAGRSSSSNTATVNGNTSMTFSDPYVPAMENDRSALHNIHVAQPHVWGDTSPQTMQPCSTDNSFVAQRPPSSDTLQPQKYDSSEQNSSGTNNTAPHELFLEVLQSQNKLLNRLGILHREGWDGSLSNVGLGNPSVLPLNDIQISDNNLRLITPENGVSMAIDNEKNTHSWRHELVNLDTPQGTLNYMDFLPTEPTDASGSPRSVDERLEYIVDAATKVGYDNFDTLAKDYYIHTFEASSSIARKQRMSRNRRLPTVISEIFSATNDWCEWARRGFYEEIVRMTESLMIFEANAAQSLLEDKLEHLVKASMQSQAISKPNLESKRLIENNVRQVSWSHYNYVACLCKSNHYTIEGLCHLDLTSQTARLGASVSHIKHIVLIFTRLRYALEKLLIRHNNMACATSAFAATCTL